MKNQFAEAWNKMVDKLGSWFDALVLSLPNIIIAIVVFIISLIAAKYISKGFRRVLERSNLQNSMKNLIAKIISVVVIVLGLFLVLGVLNLSKALNTILAGAGVAGLAVGLALQGALANTYSGIILSYIKNLKFGDWIESNSYEGEVVDINLRAVTIKQADNNLVLIPNKLVVDNPIKNYSTTSQSRVILSCGVGYESDLRAVKKLTMDTILHNFDEVENIKDIIFLWTEFGDSSINYQLRFWLNSTNALEVAKAKSESIMLIKEAYDSNNVNIPFPIRTLDVSNNVNDLLRENQSKVTP